MNKTMKIILFGSIWGFLEATLGYALNAPFVPAIISGAVMFPIVTVLLVKGYQSTQSKTAVMLITMTAIAIKSVDLFLPYVNIFKMINPMVAMLIEGLVVVAVVAYIQHRSTSRITGVITINLGWRTLYLGYFGVMALMTGNPMAPFVDTFGEIASFIFLQGAIGVVLCIGLLRASDLITEKQIHMHRLLRIGLTASILILAIVSTIVL